MLKRPHWIFRPDPDKQGVALPQATETNENRAAFPETVSLGSWSFYFLAKLLLFWQGLIGFHPLENLAFAAFILFPAKTGPGRAAKNAASMLLAAALLYYDSWLPPIGRVLSQASLLSGFSLGYLVELAGRFVSLSAIAMLVVAWVVYWLVSRRIRVGVIIISGMAAMAIFQNPATHFAAQPALTDKQVAGNAATDTMPDMDKVLQAFYSQEAARSILFPAPRPDDVPFDVIFIHVCSLSWDDLRTAGLDTHPLWRRFDFLMTNFNSASSYSGPAAIRILRSTCGQPSHADLYAPASEQCYLMDNLKRSGFEPSLALNHDGHFDDFLRAVQTQGRLNVSPLPLDGIAIAQRAFDNSPIYADFPVLARWLENRQKSGVLRMALFYNTISLHDGNHLDETHPKLNSMETYRIRLAKLLDDLEKFMQGIEKSGRRAVVAMIPEHGGAIRSDKMQIAGLREIPSPAITLVPVGIKVIGGNFQREGNTLSIGEPTSYLAVSHIIARLLAAPPFTKNSFAPSDYAAGLPVTPFVSQNDSVVMTSHNRRYYLRMDTAGWTEYAN